MIDSKLAQAVEAINAAGAYANQMPDTLRTNLDTALLAQQTEYLRSIALSMASIAEWIDAYMNNVGRTK